MTDPSNQYSITQTADSGIARTLVYKLGDLDLRLRKLSHALDSARNLKARITSAAPSPQSADERSCTRTLTQERTPSLTGDVHNAVALLTAFPAPR